MFFNENLFPEINVKATNLGLELDMTGCYRIIAESNEEWFILREKMMRLEHDAIVNENTALLNEGQVGFFKKIADFFRRLWAKVKELWGKFTAWLSNKVLTDKAFVKKYEPILRNKKTNGFEYEGYKWNIEALNIPSGVDKGLSWVANKLFVSDDLAKKTYDLSKEEKTYDEFRGAMIKGGPSSISEEDFTKEMKKAMRGGTEKVKIKGIDVREMFDTISKAEESLKKLKDDKNSVDKYYKKAIDFFDKAATELSKISPKDEKLSYKGIDEEWGEGETVTHSSATKDNDDVRKAAVTYANAQSNLARKFAYIVNLAFSAKMAAIREQRTEYRGILTKFLSYNPDKNKNESYDFLAESVSLLDRY